MSQEHFGIMFQEQFAIEQEAKERFTLLDIPHKQDPQIRTYTLIFWNQQAKKSETKFFTEYAAREAYIGVHLKHFIPIGAIRVFLGIIPDGLSAMPYLAKQRHLVNMLLNKRISIATTLHMKRRRAGLSLPISI